MKSIIKSMTFRVKGSFTIEAAVVVPITFLIIALAIIISFNAHNGLVSRANELSHIISLAPKVPENESSEMIDLSRLNGRLTLLKYRLAKEGKKKLTGGISDDE